MYSNQFIEAVLATKFQVKRKSNKLETIFFSDCRKMKYSNCK